MSAFAVACPHCQAALRSSQPVAPGRVVRCPGCSTSFNAPTRPLVTPAPAPPPPVPGGPRLTPALLVAAVFVGVLLGGGLIAGCILLLGRPADAPATVADKPAREPVEDPDLAAERKRLKAEGERLDRERSKLEAATLVGRGELALAKKEYEVAEKAFSAALERLPNDPGALKGLVEVRAARAVTTTGEEDRARRKALFDRSLTEARKARQDKQWAAAVRAFSEALQLEPTDESLAKELADARVALDADATEKKKLADYQARMEAGRVHFAAGRFADAVREFVAARQLIPGDAQAALNQKAAEARLPAAMPAAPAAANNPLAVQDLLDRCRQAMDARRFNAAVAAADKAQRLAPSDVTVRGQAQAARDALRDAQTTLAPVLASATTALRLGRIEEAYKLYGDALRVLADDPDAVKGQAAVQARVEALQLARIAYLRFMDQGTAALQDKRYLDARFAFSEALRVLPRDANALRGLRDVQAALDAIAQRRTNLDRAVQAGQNALAARRYADAVTAFNTALKLDPDNAAASAGLSQARYGSFMADGQRALATRDKGAAIKAFEAALGERPDDLAATAGLAQARAPMLKPKK